MTTKFILAFTVAAFALAGGSLAVTGNALAKDGGNGGGSSHTMKVSNDTHRDREHREAHNDRDHRDVHDDRDHRDHDRTYAHRREHEHDHSRHFWHGTWWDYGVGSCWQWSDDYDEYLWVCD
jgi:hypothetical protein